MEPQIHRHQSWRKVELLRILIAVIHVGVKPFRCFGHRKTHLSQDFAAEWCCSLRRHSMFLLNSDHRLADRP